jgi:hypothetical protein
MYLVTDRRQPRGVATWSTAHINDRGTTHGQMAFDDILRPHELELAGSSIEPRHL